MLDNLNSISHQDGVSVEHIIYDAQSVDATIDILGAFKSNHRYFWKSEPDNGQTDAINKGLRMAQGRILGYLNADDCIFSATTLATVKTLMEKSGADILYGDVEVINALGETKGLIKGDVYSHNGLLKKNYIPQPATFFRASVIERVGLFREDLKYAMDLEYWLRCGANGLKFHYEPKIFSKFREHDESKTCSQTWELIDEGYNVVRKEYFPERRFALWVYYNLAKLKLAFK